MQKYFDLSLRFHHVDNAISASIASSSRAIIDNSSSSAADIEKNVMTIPSPGGHKFTFTYTAVIVNLDIDQNRLLID